MQGEEGNVVSFEKFQQYRERLRRPRRPKQPQQMGVGETIQVLDEATRDMMDAATMALRMVRFARQNLGLEDP